MKKLKIDYDQTSADVNFLDGPPNLELPLAAIFNWQLATGNWQLASGISLWPRCPSMSN